MSIILSALKRFCSRYLHSILKYLCISRHTLQSTCYSTLKIDCSTSETVWLYAFSLVNSTVTTNYIKQNPSPEGNSHSGGQGITCLLCNLKACHHYHKSPPMESILIWLILADTLTSYFLKIHINYIHPSTFRFCAISLLTGKVGGSVSLQVCQGDAIRLGSGISTKMESMSSSWRMKRQLFRPFVQ
jgi:hypothetical protein